MNNLISCPVCDKKYLSYAMSKHIVQQGQREVYKVYKEQGYVGKGSQRKPHEDFVIENTKEFSKFTWK